MPKLSESSRLKLEYQSLLSEVDAWIEDCRCKGVENKILITLRRNGVETRIWVDATIYGSLAIHPSEISDRYWVVTHVPTGLTLGRHFATEDDAERHLICILRLIDWEKIKKADDVDLDSLPLAVRVSVIVSCRLAQFLPQPVPNFVAELRTLVELIRDRRELMLNRRQRLKIASKRRSPKTKG